MRTIQAIHNWCAQPKIKQTAHFASLGGGMNDPCLSILYVCLNHDLSETYIV